MKKATMLFLVMFSLKSLAQDSAKSEINSTASLPGTISFVISGRAAQNMYEQLSGEASEDVYYGPGQVFEKIGQGIRCSVLLKQKDYSCEFTVTKNGIMIMPTNNNQQTQKN